MEQGYHALDTVLFHVRKKVIVVGNALLVHRPLSKGNDAGPADSEAVRWNAQSLQTSIVLLVQIVLVGGNIRSSVVGNGIDPTMRDEIPLALRSVNDQT